jgi:hypothetical protein
MPLQPLTRIRWRLVAMGLWMGAIGCGTSPPNTEPVAVEPAPAADIAPPPGPPAPPTDAFLALLSPEYMAQLKTLGVPVVIPTAIPDGFAATDITVATGGDREQGYSILYRDLDNRCFLVEYTAGGVGGTPATEYRLPLTLPLFPDVDYGLNYGAFTDPDLRSQFPEPELISDWLEYGGGFYRLAGAAYINDQLNDQQSPEPPCQDLTPEEAVTIIESFTEVKDEVVGDG